LDLREIFAVDEKRQVVGLGKVLLSGPSPLYHHMYMTYCIDIAAFQYNVLRFSSKAETG
jgi:hypothetical protein